MADDAERGAGANEKFKRLIAYRGVGAELTRALAREAQDPEVKAAIKARIRDFGPHEEYKKEVVGDYLKRHVVPVVIDANSREHPEYSLLGEDFERFMALMNRIYLEVHIDRGLEYLGGGDYKVTDEKLISNRETVELISEARRMLEKYR